MSEFNGMAVPHRARAYTTPPEHSVAAAHYNRRNQDGVINEAEALRAQVAGIEVVMDRCVYRDTIKYR